MAAALSGGIPSALGVDVWVGLGEAADPRPPLYWSDSANWQGGNVPFPDGLNDVFVSVPSYLLFNPNELSVAEWNSRSAGVTRIILDTDATFGNLNLFVDGVALLEGASLQFEIAPDVNVQAGDITVDDGATFLHTNTSSQNFVVSHNVNVLGGGTFHISGGEIGGIGSGGGHGRIAWSDSQKEALFKMSGGIAHYIQGASIGGGGNATIHVSGGELNFYGAGGEISIGRMLEGEVAQAGTQSTLRITGGEVNLIAEDPEGPLTLLIGEQYAGRLEVSGTGALNVDGSIYLGGTQDGVFTITGGSVQAGDMRLGMTQDPYLEDGAYIGTQVATQSGGSVVLQVTPYDGGGRSEGLWMNGKNSRPNQYNLNGGTLQTYQTLVNDYATFVQNGGSHEAGRLVVSSTVSTPTYTLSAGELSVEDYVGVLQQGVFNQNGGAVTGGDIAVSLGGVYHFLGGTLEVENATLRGASSVFEHGAGRTFSVSGDARVDTGFVYALNGAGSEWEIGGTLELFDTAKIEATAGVLTVKDMVIYDDAVLEQAGANVVATGTTSILGGEWSLESGVIFHTGSFEVADTGRYLQTGGTFTGKGFVVGLLGEADIQGGSMTVGTDGLTVETGGFLTVDGVDLTVNGAGSVGGTVRLTNAGSAEFGTLTVQTVGTLEVEGGTTLQAEVLDFSAGTLKWEAGTIHITGSDVAFNSGTQWGANFTLDGGRHLWVDQKVEVIAGSTGFVVSGSGSLLRAGELELVMNSQSVFNVQGGSLVVDGDFSQFGDPTRNVGLSNAAQVSVGGDWILESGARVLQQSTGSTVEVDGALRLSGNGARYLMQGTFATPSLLTTGTTVVGDEGGMVLFQQFSYTTHETGQLIVGAGETAEGTYDIRSGSTLEAGSVTVGQDGAGVFTSDTATVTVTGTFANNGSYHQKGGSFSAAKFVNTGTAILEKSTGIPVFSAELDNSGLLEVRDDYTIGGAGFTHRNSGTLLLDGAVLQLQSALVNEAGGRIEGTGGIGIPGVAITDHGVLAPGRSPGLLTIYGDYTQAADGVLEMEIGGFGPSLYDRISVSISGSAEFFGTLNITFINDYMPEEGDLFSLISGANTVYDFLDVNVSGLDPALGFNAFQSGGSFQLEITAVPEPANTALLLSAACALWLAARRRKGNRARDGHTRLHSACDRR